MHVYADFLLLDVIITLWCLNWIYMHSHTCRHTLYLQQFLFIHTLTFHSFSYLLSTTVQRQTVLLLMCHQKANSSLKLCRSACVDILSPHIIIIIRVRTIQQDILRNRAYSHTFYFSTLLWFSILVLVIDVNLLLA